MAAGWSELVGGALLAVGLFTPLAALLIISVMTTAILAVHAKNGPWVTDGGFEYNLVVIAVAFVVAAVPGGWSLDAALDLGGEVHGAGWALGALALGVIGGYLVLVAGRSPKLAGAPPTPTAEAQEQPQEQRFERPPADTGASTTAEQDRPGIPADPR